MQGVRINVYYLDFYLLGLIFVARIQTSESIDHFTNTIKRLTRALPLQLSVLAIKCICGGVIKVNAYHSFCCIQCVNLSNLIIKHFLGKILIFIDA